LLPKTPKPRPSCIIKYIVHLVVDMGGHKPRGINAGRKLKNHRRVNR